jgi:hypothetical protein
MDCVQGVNCSRGFVRNPPEYASDLLVALLSRIEIVEQVLEGRILAISTNGSMQLPHLWIPGRNPHYLPANSSQGQFQRVHGAQYVYGLRSARSAMQEG